MGVKLIVAMCKNNGIGFNNKIPWKIPEDMSYFSKKTSGNYLGDGDKKNVVIMGRNTWDSLPKKYKPLPRRFNIVLTRNVQRLLVSDQRDVVFLSSIDDAMNLCYGQGEKGEKGENPSKMKSVSCNFNDIWIIGGSSVYQEFIKHEMNTELSKYYITYIDKDYDCDTYFPFLENMNKYHITRFEKQKCIDNNTRDKSPLNVYYIVFKKIKYTDEKRIEELFTSYKSIHEKKSNLILYVKNADIAKCVMSNMTADEHEILFSMFCS
jgi:dihydrofolate reductase